jgi:hypothetical protein
MEQRAKARRVRIPRQRPKIRSTQLLRLLNIAELQQRLDAQHARFSLEDTRDGDGSILR